MDGPGAETVPWSRQIQFQWALGKLLASLRPTECIPLWKLGCRKAEGWEQGRGAGGLGMLVQTLGPRWVKTAHSKRRSQPPPTTSVPCSPAHRYCSQGCNPSFQGVEAKLGHRRYRFCRWQTCGWWVDKRSGVKALHLGSSRILTFHRPGPFLASV